MNRNHFFPHFEIYLHNFCSQINLSVPIEQRQHQQNKSCWGNAWMASTNIYIIRCRFIFRIHNNILGSLTVTPSKPTREEIRYIRRYNITDHILFLVWKSERLCYGIGEWQNLACPSVALCQNMGMVTLWIVATHGDFMLGSCCQYSVRVLSTRYTPIMI